MLHVKFFAFNPLQENTYIVYNDKGNAIIIDPGCYFSAEQEMLQGFLKSNKLAAVQLINTHCHLDHVFGNKWVHKTLGLELHIHPLEEKVLEFAPQSGMKWGIPFENYNGSLHFINQGDTIKLDDDELKILFTPGHSPGSISLYSEKQSFVIAGDVLFYESIGRTDLPGGDYATLINAIKTQLFVLPEETIIYNGHGKSTTVRHEKMYNPFLR